LLGLSQNEAREQVSPFLLRGPRTAAPSRQGDSVEWVNRFCAQPHPARPEKNGGATLSQVESSRIDYQGQAAFQFFFREVTDRGRLEQQLRQAEKLSNLGQMISGVAHELNNPLSVIKGYLDLIVAHHPISPQTRADLGKVVQECDRAAKLVRQFLSFAHDHPARREMVDVNTLIQRVADLRRADIAAAGIELFMDLAPALPSTSADPDQVQQVIINLLNNAIQAMAASPRPRALRITTRIKDPGHAAHFDGRQRSGRAREPAKPHLRAVLHHQTRWRRHRPRSFHCAQHHGRTPRTDQLRCTPPWAGRPSTSNFPSSACACGARPPNRLPRPRPRPPVFPRASLCSTTNNASPTCSPKCSTCSAISP
jgi:hypothetical protein